MKISSFLLFFFCSSILFSQEETKPSTETPIVEARMPSPPALLESDANSIYDFPDVEAEFKGGKEALHKFIVKNFVYPSEAIEQNIAGIVYVSFVVEKNGSISNIVIERGVHQSLDREVKSMIKKMPKWKPGKVNGKKVRVRCRLPVNCTLN